MYLHKNNNVKCNQPINYMIYKTNKFLDRNKIFGNLGNNKNFIKNKQLRMKS